MNDRFAAPRGRIYDDITQTIGGTPLVRAPRLSAAKGARADVLLKLEFFNPGTSMECLEASMERLPVPDGSVDVVISNGVLNLSFRKRKVVEEMFRVLKPGGHISITDIVSAKQLSQSIVNDPKLWAS